MAMILRLLLAVGLALLWTGCGKKSPPAALGAAASAAQEETKAAAPAPANVPAGGRPPAVVQPVVISSGVDPSAACGQLTEALRKFALEQRRMPASFQDLIAAGYIRGVPEPPPGKQFKIDPTHGSVVVVNR